MSWGNRRSTAEPTCSARKGSLRHSISFVRLVYQLKLFANYPQRDEGYWNTFCIEHPNALHKGEEGKIEPPAHRLSLGTMLLQPHYGHSSMETPHFCASRASNPEDWNLQLISYFDSLWSRVLDKSIFTQRVKKFTAFRETRRFSTVLTTDRHWSLLWAR